MSQLEKAFREGAKSGSFLKDLFRIVHNDMKTSWPEVRPPYIVYGWPACLPDTLTPMV